MINHIQILNIADHLKTQKYALNKQRGETIIKYVKQNQITDELLGLYKELSIVRFYLFSETDADLGQKLMNQDDELNKKIKEIEE